MTWLAVEKDLSPNAASSSEDTQMLKQQIRQLAFRLFENRYGSEGNDGDAWLTAEREVTQIHQPELEERDGKFEFCVSAIGLDARDIRVTASLSSVAVRAEGKDQCGREGENLP